MLALTTGRTTDSNAFRPIVAYHIPVLVLVLNARKAYCLSTIRVHPCNPWLSFSPTTPIRLAAALNPSLRATLSALKAFVSIRSSNQLRVKAGTPRCGVRSAQRADPAQKGSAGTGNRSGFLSQCRRDGLRYGWCRRKNRFPGGLVSVRELVPPELVTPPLVVQLAGIVRLLFCSKLQPATSCQ